MKNITYCIIFFNKLINLQLAKMNQYVGVKLILNESFVTMENDKDIGEHVINNYSNQ